MMTLDTYRRNAGFTLIELMIVVGIVAILAAVAYPAYTGHVIKTRRSEAAACMMEVAQFMERDYTTRMTYRSDITLPGCVASVQNHYTVRLREGSVSANAFIVEAVPVNRQLAKDVKCGTLALNEKGTKSVSVSGTAATSCW